jgi:NTE family protein
VALAAASGDGARQAMLAAATLAGDNALILSGGGANGAYEVGVVKALLAGASPGTGGVPLAPRIYTGTSVGAYNAAWLAQHADAGPASALGLEAIWNRRVASTLASCGNGVYRLRADPARWLDPGCLAHPVANALTLIADAAFWTGYGLVRGLNFVTSDEPLRVRTAELIDFGAIFSAAPLATLIEETIDLGRLAASPAALRVATTDWQVGKARVFSKAEMVGAVGTAAIQASAAIPGIFPPVSIDGRLYVDGGLLMSTPLKPAIDAGARVLHIVYVDPAVVNIPYPDLPNTLDALYRIYVIAIAGNANQDITMAALVNEDQELAEMVRTDRAGRRLRRIERVLEHARRGEPYRPLIIHRYRPHLPLGNAEGLLDFRERRIDDLIARGYDDAVHHDCDAEQCVMPPEWAAPAGRRR